ncbi:MAG: antitoxin [Oscillospiraceae bacterium]|nr:antitoxin [Oscillospiraceae bacterium]
MAYSDAQKEATARYNKKAYDRISVVVPKGKRAVIAEFAAQQGKSLNAFINEAIDFQMKQAAAENKN